MLFAAAVAGCPGAVTLSGAAGPAATEAAATAGPSRRFLLGSIPSKLTLQVFS